MKGPKSLLKTKHFKLFITSCSYFYKNFDFFWLFHTKIMILSYNKYWAKYKVLLNHEQYKFYRCIHVKFFNNLFLKTL